MSRRLTGYQRHLSDVAFLFHSRTSQHSSARDLKLELIDAKTGNLRPVAMRTKCRSLTRESCSDTALLHSASPLQHAAS